MVVSRCKGDWVECQFIQKGMSMYRLGRLERKGAYGWDLIDGRNTVGDIIKRLANQFNNEEGYESRITTYIGQLQKDGFITYSLPAQP